jgi:hypothetical protein
VRSHCLAVALDEEYDATVVPLSPSSPGLRVPVCLGIRGGMTPHERADIVAERAGLGWRSRNLRGREGSLQMQREVS